MNKSLTIVLPVYNAESRLRRNVQELLEIASELTARFGVLIIDDGSTDATFEVAEELAAHYPQVSVRRHRHRRGLGAAMEYAQRRVRSDAVLVHDGASPVDPNQLRSAWRRWTAQSAVGEHESASATAPECDTRDFARLRAIHAAMEHAHGRILGFQWITPHAAGSAPAAGASSKTRIAPRRDAPHSAAGAGVGEIPPLPRPKFLSALADFAWGE